MTIAAPTGAGKTVIFELAIVRLHMNCGSSNMKCLYIAPNKALCQQKLRDWTQNFGPLGIRY